MFLYGGTPLILTVDTLHGLWKKLSQSCVHDVYNRAIRAVCVIFSHICFTHVVTGDLMSTACSLYVFYFLHLWYLADALIQSNHTFISFIQLSS